jgi:hypothetical protein
MSSTSGRPYDDAMAGEVDRLLRQLGQGAPARPRSTPSSRPGTATSIPGDRPAPLPLPSPLGVWGRVLLGAILVGALTRWPYFYCGLALASYLSAAAFAVLAGVLGARAAWRRRMGWAHTLALLVIMAGGVLGAHQVLMRVGYTATSAAWGCPG